MPNVSKFLVRQSCPSLEAFDEATAQQSSRFEQVLSNALTSLPLSSEEAAIVKAAIEAL